jgi:hypothetical protein
MAQTDVNKTAPQAGNVNPQMGEAHKKMIAARLTQHEDLLTVQMAQINNPDVVCLTSCCSFRSGEDESMAEKGSEIGFVWEGLNAKGETIQGQCDVAVKGCNGFGTLNQLALFWLADVLAQHELSSDAGQALLSIVGGSSNSHKQQGHVSPGSLMQEGNAKRFGMPLQSWLGEKDNLAKFVEKALAIKPGVTGQKILMLGMRGAGEQGEDVFVAVDSGKLGAYILDSAISQAGFKKFLKIGLDDKALKFTASMELKRMGGDKSNHNCDQTQIIIKTKGLLNILLEGKEGKNNLNGMVYMEPATAASVAIDAMNINKNPDAEPGVTAEKKAFWKRLDKWASSPGEALNIEQLSGISDTVKHKKFA